MFQIKLTMNKDTLFFINLLTTMFQVEISAEISSVALVKEKSLEGVFQKICS